MIKGRTTSRLKQLLSHAALTRLSKVNVTREQFTFFITQKSFLTNNFSQFIFTCIQKVKSLDNQSLVDVLLENYSDELGVNENGDVEEHLAHTSWRDDFHKALGLDGDALSLDNAMKGSLECRDAFARFTRTAHPMELIGAFLMLERLVPMEYRVVQTARNALFPEIFVPQESDSVDVVAAKELACQYIDRHIEHDAKYHFPALLKALEKYEDDESLLQKIESGVDFLCALREKFYDAVCGHWSQQDKEFAA